MVCNELVCKFSDVLFNDLLSCLSFVILEWIFIGMFCIIIEIIIIVVVLVK